MSLDPRTPDDVHLCVRCYDALPDSELIEPSCQHDPARLHGPLGMYHCPDCGAMLLAGMAHGLACGLCYAQLHHQFDELGPLVTPEQRTVLLKEIPNIRTGKAAALLGSILPEHAEATGLLVAEGPGASVGVWLPSRERVRLLTPGLPELDVPFEDLTHGWFRLQF